MTDLSTIKPKTLEHLKRLATQIKKTEGIPHHQALDKAAIQAGFQSFREAQMALPADKPRSTAIDGAKEDKQ